MKNTEYFPSKSWMFVARDWSRNADFIVWIGRMMLEKNTRNPLLSVPWCFLTPNTAPKSAQISLWRIWAHCKDSRKGHSPKLQQKKENYRGLRMQRTANKLPGALWVLKPRHFKLWSMDSLYLSTGAKQGAPCPSQSSACREQDPFPAWGHSGVVGRRFALWPSRMDFTINKGGQAVKAASFLLFESARAARVCGSGRASREKQNWGIAAGTGDVGLSKVLGSQTFDFCFVFSFPRSQIWPWHQDHQESKAASTWTPLKCRIRTNCAFSTHSPSIQFHQNSWENVQGWFVPLELLKGALWSGLQATLSLIGKKFRSIRCNKSFLFNNPGEWSFKRA